MNPGAMVKPVAENVSAFVLQLDPLFTGFAVHPRGFDVADERVELKKPLPHILFHAA